MHTPFSCSLFFNVHATASIVSRSFQIFLSKIWQPNNIDTELESKNLTGISQERSKFSVIFSLEKCFNDTAIMCLHENLSRLEWFLRSEAINKDIQESRLADLFGQNRGFLAAFSNRKTFYVYCGVCTLQFINVRRLWHYHNAFAIKLTQTLHLLVIKMLFWPMVKIMGGCRWS